MPLYDLSHPLESGMPVYPGTDPVRFEPTATVQDDGYRTTRLDLDSHTGTHVDAPAHTTTGPSLEELPLETFRFRARVVDLRPLEARDPITTSMLREATAGTRDVDLLVVRTGWEVYWGTEHYFDHPYLTPEAAEWLLENDCHLGLDTLNPDPTPTEHAASSEPDGFPVHHTLFEDERVILENLRGLEQVDGQGGVDLHAYPLAIGDGDGSPVRAVAILE